MGKCETCGKEFASRKALGSHCYNSHRPDKPTTSCRLCQKLNHIRDKEISPIRSEIASTDEKDKTKLAELNKQLEPILQHYKKVEDMHPRCAACGIFMGSEHIETIWVEVKGHKFCPTCPKKVSSLYGEE